MINVYVVIGQARTGKSTLIRKLSGAYFRGKYNIQDSVQKTHEFFVQIRSLQEAKLKPEVFIKEMEMGKINNVLVALRKTSRICSGWCDYVEAFKKAGWKIKGTVNMEEFENNIREVSKKEILDSITSIRIAKVRKKWGWKDVD